MKLCAEPQAAVALGLLSEWGLIELRPGALERVQALADLLGDPRWMEVAEPALAVHAAAFGLDFERELVVRADESTALKNS